MNTLIKSTESSSFLQRSPTPCAPLKLLKRPPATRVWKGILGIPDLTKMGGDDFTNSRQTGQKIPDPVPKFWQIPLPREQSNPESRQDILRFPESRTVFWSNPGSREYPSRPCYHGMTYRTKFGSYSKR